MWKAAILAIVFVISLSCLRRQAAAQSADIAQPQIQAGHTHDINEVKWSPDSRRLISYSAGDGYIKLWEAASGRLLWSVRTGFIQQKDEHYTLTSFGWSEDESLIASASGNGMIQAWDATTGKLRWNVRGHADNVNVVAFSPDGRLFAAGGHNQNIRVRETQSGESRWGLLPLPSREELEAIDAKTKLYLELKSENEKKILQADAETARWEGKVRVAFGHYGEPINPLNVRLLEPSRPHQRTTGNSASSSSGVWLRLHNDSPLPVEFSTDSQYLNASPKCGYTISTGKLIDGLCDGTEVGIRYGVKDADGQPIPWGLDFGAISMLPPGASVFFSVRRQHLEAGRSIYVDYKYQKENDKKKLEDYGSERRVYFQSSDLPR